MTNMLKKLWSEEQGQGMTEYGLIIALVAIFIIAVMIGFRDKIAGVFTAITGDTRF